MIGSNKEGSTNTFTVPYELGLRLFINLNIAYILLPETLIWIAVTHFELSFSPLHKIFLLILFLLYLMSVPSRKTEPIALLLVIFSTSTIVGIFYFQNIESLFASFADIFRLLLLFGAFYYFKVLVDTKKIGLNFFSRFVWISFYLISINLLLGALGFGNEQRSFGVGTRGFFNAGNDIATVTLILAAFILSEKYEKGWKIFLLYFAYFFFLAYLLNTKATLIGLLIIVLILPAYGNLKSRLPKKVFTKLAFLAFLFPLIIGAGLIILTKINFWDRYLTFVDQFKGESWITFMLSRRDEHLLQGLEFTHSNFNFFNYLFGYSPGEFLSKIPFRAEIDPFEIFFYYGIIGLVIVYWWFIKSTIRSYKSKAQRGSSLFIYSRGLFISNIILLLQSITAGHVFMSVLVCVFLGCLNAGTYLNHDETT